MALPALRQPVVLDGYRGSGVGDPNKNYRLLVDLNKIDLKPGQAAFYSDSNGLRLLLAGAKTVKDSQRRVISETEPLEVRFENGFLVTDDPETIKLMMAHPQRGKLFYSHDDLMGMQDAAHEKRVEEVLSALSPAGFTKLKQKLNEKSFNLGNNEEAPVPKRGKSAA